MIISASRRTDIPAFYSAWLMNRIRAGFCIVPNPFNARQIRRISLAPEDVDAFVFWSKNPRPMLELLPELNDRGFVYCFLFTLNHYPRAFEPFVPDVERRLETFLELSRRLGPDRVVWRYDPIILTRATNHEFHAAAFERLAASLRGATRRVIVSLVDRYRKTDIRMSGWKDTDLEMDFDLSGSPETVQLMSHIGRAARAAGMAPFTCSEENDFFLAGVRPGGCIDQDLIRSLGARVPEGKDPGQRAACRCVNSRDIGSYDTCLHGCPYCYATKGHRTALQRHARHDPDSPVLIGLAADQEEVSGTANPSIFKCS